MTEQDFINLRKLAEQQKNQRAEKIQSRILKQTHDVKLAESLSPVTKKVEVKKSTKKLGDVIKESNSANEKNPEIVPVESESDISEGDNTSHNMIALPNSSIFSGLMTKTLGRLMFNANSLRIKSSPSGASSLGVPIYTPGGDPLRIRDNDYELTPEICKALSCTGYTGKTMKNENYILLMYNIVKDLGHTGAGDRDSKGKTFFTITLPKLVEKIQNKISDEIKDDSDDLHGDGLKIKIPSNINDNYTRLEVVLGLKLSGHTDTLTEASNLIDQIYKMGDKQNEQPYRNALDKFHI